MNNLASTLDLTICQQNMQYATCTFKSNDTMSFSQTDYILANCPWDDTRNHDELIATTSDHLPLSTLILANERSQIGIPTKHRQLVLQRLT